LHGNHIAGEEITMNSNANKMGGGIDFARIVDGVIRAAKLDKAFYQLVAHDTTYSQDALVVVIVSSLVGALGGLLGSLFTGHIILAITTFVFGSVIAVGSYYLWVFVAQFVGTQFFKGTGDFGAVQRTLGFAYPRGCSIS
jgi:hypothetical protein